MQVDYETVAKILHGILQNNVIFASGLNTIWVNDLATAIVTKLNEVQEVKDRMVAVEVKREKLKEHYRIDNLALEAETDHIQKSCPHYSWAERGDDHVRVVYCRICEAILEQENL